MTVLEAPKELEALVGLFGKLYVYTFDCATFYSDQIEHEKNVGGNVHRPPLETQARITVFKSFWTVIIMGWCRWILTKFDSLEPYEK